MQSSLLSFLQPFIDSAYQAFSKKLNPGVTQVLGVRIPQIKTLAKQMVKTENISILLKQNHLVYMEEKILYGCIVAYSNLSFVEKQEYIKALLSTCTCWAETDTLVSVCSFIKTNLPAVWQDLPSFINGTEFEQRWFFLVQMKYFLTQAYLPQIFENICRHGQDVYYVNMAKAWLLCEALIHFYEPTKRFLQSASLNPWVKNKAIQKARESYRLIPAQKQELKSLRAT